MEEFTSNLNRKYFIFSILNMLMMSLAVFLILSLFLELTGSFWKILPLVMVLGIITGFRTKHQVVKFYDRLLAARGNLITGYEFCYKQLPGSAQLKQEAVNRINAEFKRLNLGRYFAKKIILLFLLLFIILMIPRFYPYSYSYVQSVQVIPGGDTVVTYGAQVVFKLITDDPDHSWKLMLGEDSFEFERPVKDTCRLVTPPLFYPVDYSVGNSDTVITTGTIQLISEPLSIGKLEVTVPEYLGGYRIFPDYQDQIIIPEYSKVSYTLYSATPVQQWEVEDDQFIADSDSHHLMIEAEISDSVYFFIQGFTVLDETLDFSMQVLGVEDQSPRCVRSMPENDLFKIGNFEYIDLTVWTEDDYGLTGAKLVVVDPRQANNYQHISLNGTGPLEVNFRISPDQLAIGPGETATVFVEVGDNSPGGNFSRCSPLRIVFPTLSEIYQAADSASQNYQSTAMNLQERGSELLNDLSRIQQQMQQSANLSSMDRQHLQQILQQEQQMMENLSMASEDLQDILENLLNQSVADSLILAKSQEISELLNEIMDEQTRQMLQELMELAESADREEVLKALEQLRQNNEQLLERLDRTLEILKNLETARKLEELLKRSLELTSRINNLENADNQSPLVEDITSELEDILNQLEQLIDKNLSEPVNSELEQALQSGQQAQTNLDQLQQSSSNQDNTQQQAVAQMSEMTGHLQNASQMLNQSRNSALAGLISEVKEDVLDLSELTENIYQQHSPVYLSAAAFKATEQVVVKLDSIAKMTMMMDIRIISMLNQANELIRQASQPSQYKDIYKIYNDAYVQLSNLENMMQSQMPSNSQGTQQSMSEMAGQQAQLNIESMQNMLQGMSPSQMMTMAAQQRALSERMSEISQGFEGSAQMIDQMEQVVREMEMAARALEQGDVSRNLIERQREILQKLLDLQTAMMEQQNRPQRVAQTAHHYPPYPFISGIDNYFDLEYNTRQNQLPFNLNAVKSPYWDFLINRLKNAD